MKHKKLLSKKLFSFPSFYRRALVPTSIINMLSHAGPIFLLFWTLVIPQWASAYPEFIGYKYTSCITCHYNGQGNGPLNDYGRAVWASEIAGRMFSGNKTPEQLGESSGVAFSSPEKMWWWMRPGIKARQLVYHANAGKSDSDTRTILMQAEANTAIFFNKQQSLIFVGSFGYIPTPHSAKTNPAAPAFDNWISREHYIRWRATESSWIYAGMVDKVYGLRISNHMAFSRARTGLNQSDQSHGIIYHYIKPSWELTVNGFFGSMYQESELRQVGGSMMFEYDIVENFRVGASALVSSNDFIGQRRFGVHSKRGYGNGTAILFEVGVIDDAPKYTQSRMGYYIFSEAMQRIRRGHHFFISGQAYKEDLSGKYQDTLRFGAGLLMFPMQRLEFRLEAENERKLASDEVQDEKWSILGQIHLSM